MIRKTLVAAGFAAGLFCLAQGVSLAGAAPGPAPAPAPQNEELNDIVSQVGNNPLTNVKITVDKWDGVTVRLPGNNANTSSITADVIEDVNYAGRPAEYNTAQEQQRAGKFQEAIQAYDAGMKKLKGDDSCQKQYFQMGRMECYAALRQPDQVAKAFGDLLAKDPEASPRLIYGAYLKMGDVYFQNRNFVEAEKVFKAADELFDKLEAKARAGGKDGLEKFINRYVMTARFWRIRCIEEQKKIEGADGAEMAYKLFPSKAGKYPDLVALSEIAIGRCMLLRPKPSPEEAITYLKGIEKKVPASMVPLVYCALADAYMVKAASAQNNGELDYYPARWYYLKVVVQLPLDRSALAQAYYGAGRCYEELGKLGKENQGQAKEKSAKMFQTVVKDFPESPEFLLAKERLGKT